MSTQGKAEEGNIRNGIVLSITAVFVLAVLAFVFFLVRGSMSKPTYTVAEHTLTISGQYGVQIDLEGAAVTHEFTRLPEAEMKTDGAAIGTIQKGTFQLNGTKVYLNIMDTNASDYLLIRDGEGYGYYIVCETPEETEALYEEIMDQVG